MPYSRSDILNQNTQDFPNNNSGQITPAILRDFNANFVNSVQFIGDPTDSASYAATASIATSASYANNATLAATASFFSGSVVSASYANNATSASYANNATSASYANNSTSASYAINATTAATASFYGGSVVSASYAATASIATTASYALNVPTINTGSFATTGSNSFNGNQTINGNLNVFGTSNFISGSGLQVRGNSFSVEDNSSVTKFQVNTAANLIVVRLPMSASEGITGSLFGTASFAIQALSASFYGGSVVSASYASSSTSASYALNATSASFASTIASGLNITASNILVTNNLNVNGTASFGYLKTVTGSAVIVGDAFIILNADTPTAPFAGIQVYDTGSASTASFEWNGNNDYWITVEETGQSAGVLTGVSGSKGSEIFPSANRLTKGSGNNTILNSNITDNGSSVSINSNTTITGSLNVSAGITGSLLGTASFANNATSASYALNATSASFAPSSPAFPFSGSAEITGSLSVTGSITAIGVTNGMTGSLVLNQQSGLNLLTSIQNVTTQRNMQQYVTESLQTNQIGGANTYIGYTARTATGSLVISGSANYINVTTLMTNANAIAGAKSGFSGNRNFIFSVPTLLTASFNDPQWVSISNSWIGATPVITNNFQGVTGNTSITNAFINSTVTANLKSGSLFILNSNINWTTTINANQSGSFNTITNAYLAGSGVLTINQFDYAGSSTGSDGTQNIASSGFYGGNTHTYYIPSGSGFNSGIRHSAIVGETLIVTGSIASSGMGAGIFGTYNTNDGRINHLDHIRFAVSTGTAAGARRTSLYVSASGDTVIQNNLLVTGSATFSGSLTLTGSLNATSFTGSLSGSATNGFPYTGSAKITGSLGITGSLSVTNGVEVKAGDLDFSGGNINIYNGNINQIAGASTLQTTIISGSLTLKQGATGSLLGTSSYADNATSASYAISSSNALFAQTASYFNGTVVSASYAVSASNALNAQTASYYNGSVVSASYATNSTSASYANNATSASFAQTAISASWAPTVAINTGSFATTGSNTFIGNQTITGSINISGSIIMVNGTDLVTHHVKAPASNGVEIQNSSAGVVALFGAGGSLGSTFYGQVNATAFSGSGTLVTGVISSSYAANATTAATASYFNGTVVSASYANNSTSASYALTASYAMNGGSGGASFPYTGSAVISGSLGVTGSTRGNIVTVTAVAQTASLDLSKGNAFIFNATATAASASLLTLTNIPTNSNQKFSLLISQSVAGGANVYFDNTFQFPSASQYTVSTTTGSEDILTFETYTY